MKIAFVYDAVYPWVKGGAEKRVYELATRLVKRGHEVHWYSIGWWWPEKGKKDILMDGIHLHGVSNPVELYSDDRRSIKEAFIFSFKLFKPLMRENFDVIDCQGFPFFSCFTAKFHALRGKSKLIITLHEVWNDYWYEYLGKPGIFGVLVEKTMLSLTENFITVSKKTKKDLRRIRKSEKSIVIPNGIDYEMIRGTVPSKEEYDLIFAGRLIKEKNVDILINAVSIVGKHIPDIKCIIIGEGPEKNNLEKLVKKLQIEDNIIFKGFMEGYSDLIGQIKSTKVFVLPSKREGFGIVVIEANACGVPVVVVDQEMNAAKDLVVDGVNGYIADANPVDVAEKIVKSFENKDIMEDKCVEMSEEYDWNKIVDSLENVYRELCN
jgi:glycosyltransferase involved in cell wall biosynthesis